MEIRLNHEGSGFTPHHGGPKSVAFSGDGKIYFAQQGWVNKQFGMYVLVQDNATSRARVYPYRSPILQGQGGFNETGGSLWLDANLDDNNKGSIVVRIDAFVPTATGGGVVTVPIPDQEARRLAQQALDTANKASKQVESVGKSLVELYDDVRVVEKQVEGLPEGPQIWQKIQDALFDQKNRWLSYQDPFLFNVLWDRGVRLLEKTKLIAKDSIPVNDKNVKDR